MDTPLSTLLRKFMDRAHIGVRPLAKQSGVLEKTIEKWRSGEVRKPRYWQDLLKVATALHLPPDEVDALLQAAGHPTHHTLKATVTAAADQKLVAAIATPPGTPAPFQAIAALAHFVGREHEVAQIQKLLRNGHHVTVVSFAGMGGVGKTALAVHLAYQLRPHFPDGVLWARVDATDAFSILGAFASALGHNVDHLRDLETRSAAVRSLLATRRVLVILDNVTTSAQVRPLLPPTTGASVALITTRHDLAISDELYRCELLPFDPARGEALALFAHFLGQAFVQRHQSMLANIADFLGHLPLAISIAAARIRAPSARNVANFLAELQVAGQRLDLLQREDRSVRLSFDLSYRHLEAPLQQFFDTLGVLGGEDFDLDAVAYITQTPLTLAASNLAELRRRFLVQPTRSTRYNLHPLLRLYALEHLNNGDYPANNPVQQRMVEYFVTYTERHATDFAALRQEVSNLFAAQQVAVEQGLAALLLRLTNALFPFLEVQGLYDVANEHLIHANLAAAQSGNQAIIATVKLYQGVILMRKGNYHEAEENYRQAMAIAQRIDQHEIAARLHRYLSATCFSYGDYTKAFEHAQDSLQIAQNIGNIDLIGQAYVSRGATFDHQNHLQAAEHDYRTALHYAGQIGRPIWLLTLWVNLGENLVNQNKVEEVENLWVAGLSYARELNHQERISNLLANLAGLFRTRGELQKAEEFVFEGLTIARQIGHRWLMSINASEWGYVQIGHGNWQAATTAFTEALALAKEIDAQHLVGEALYGLARTMAAQHNLDQARHYAAESLRIFTTISFFRAGEVQSWLATLENSRTDT